MKTHLLPGLVARLVPELAKDSRENNERLIKNMLDNELTKPVAVLHSAATTASPSAGATRRAS